VWGDLDISLNIEYFVFFIFHSEPINQDLELRLTEGHNRTRPKEHCASRRKVQKQQNCRVEKKVSLTYLEKTIGKALEIPDVTALRILLFSAPRLLGLNTFSRHSILL